MESAIHRIKELNSFCNDFLQVEICTKNGFALSGRLHFLSKFLQTQNIPYNLALSVMDRHQLSSDNVRSMKISQLENFLHDLFYIAQKLNFISEPFQWRAGSDGIQRPFNPEHQAALFSNLLHRIFDLTNTKCISILELKVALFLLCASKSVEELVQHNLNLLIDHNRCIHQSRFKLTTVALLKVFHLLDPTISVDTDTISGLVANAFNKVTGLAGLSDTQFQQFWTTENRKNSQEISFFFNSILFSRSLNSSTVHENIPCTGCDSFHRDGDSKSIIVGLRFKCNRCNGFNLCTRCFLSDFQTGRHSASSHKFTIIEEAIEGEKVTTNKQPIGLFAKLLRVFNLLRSKGVTENINSLEEVGKDQEQDEVKTIRFLDATPMRTPQKNGGTDNITLLTVIEMLSKENRAFQEKLEQIQQTCSPDSELYKYLEQHKNILTAQIDHLYTIWKTSASDGDDQATPLIASIKSPISGQAQKFHSTPFRPNNLKTIQWDLTALDASSVTNANSAESALEASKYIRGEDLARTYYEANRSNRSLEEISTWLHLRESYCPELTSLQQNKSGGKLNEAEGMKSFKELLQKVRDILDDTYSDNAQLSVVTRQLETVLDDIIGEEEKKVKGKKGVENKNTGRDRSALVVTVTPRNSSSYSNQMSSTKDICF